MIKASLHSRVAATVAAVALLLGAFPARALAAAQIRPRPASRRPST